ncbi:MAG: hypothetical protein F6K53_34025 [Moorea sp. SIO4A1]|uniref:hypothetical protein n=1 Tax=Moorena sp. SIO4A1 TaxID=2607835 RepID=UPI00144C4162|nr:hypothetical protein [Moorena sp. SIO4A1]NEQ62158.1 hypothetical protein [Moorena sp. SIO4A1]
MTWHSAIAFSGSFASSRSGGRRPHRFFYTSASPHFPPLTTPDTLPPTPDTLHPTPYTLLPTPYSRLPTP